MGCSDPCSLAKVDITDALQAAFEGKATSCQADAIAEWTGHRQKTVGPWKQDVHRAVSTDGLHFTAVTEPAGTPVLRSAAVPEIVLGPEGKYYLYFVDGDLDALVTAARAKDPALAQHGLPGVGALALAISEDGITFTRSSEFAIEGLGVGMAVDPDVVQLGDGTWRMFYLALSVREYTKDATWSDGEKHEVHTAVSRDLIHWHSEGSVVRGPFADPSVTCFPLGGCMMLSFGLGVGYSQDRRHYDYRGSWRGVDGFAPEFSWADDARVRVFYNDKATGAAVKSTSSLDNGATWVDDPGTRLDVYGEAVTVVKRPEGDWWMYYHTFQPGVERPRTPK